MDVLDLFSRTFLPLAAEAGIPIATMSRHVMLFRRYAEPDEPALLVASCTRTLRPGLGSAGLMLITRRHLVVTCEGRVLHRPRLYLAAPLTDLQAVTWDADTEAGQVEVAVSTPTSRDRFLLRSSRRRQLRRFEAVLDRAFGPPAHVRPTGVDWVSAPAAV